MTRGLGKHHAYLDGFVRVTARVMLASGKTAPRTYWARPVKRTPARVTYRVLNKDGSEWRGASRGDSRGARHQGRAERSVVIMAKAKKAKRADVDPGDDPAWVRCQSCNGYWCLIHGQHAETCPCPELSQWWGRSPYARGSRATGPGV